jgi:lipopolysaccharide/colanic/teichoic acid biosynthesis glycosyltransferase
MSEKICGTFKDRNREAQAVLKRVLDVFLAGSLLIMVSPLLVLAAYAIALESPGPVIFMQKRVGRDRREFIFYKLRSMYTGSSEQPHKDYVKRLITGSPETGTSDGRVYKLRDDPRVTPAGKFLRKTSIDELPQLYNVLKGDMSLVGPRPAIPYELDYYSSGMFERFSAPPGITGLWQTSGRSGMTYRQMVDLDIEYIRAWSFNLDSMILLKTAVYILDFSRVF